MAGTRVVASSSSFVASSFVVAFVVLVGSCEAFPEGAPIDACVLETPNRPNHQGTKPLDPSTSKHRFTASSYQYFPGSTIKVRINGPPFKGFFVQARDVSSNEWIGSFVESDHTTSFPQCSAVTHSTKPPKTNVLLLWRAPYDRAGNVKFTGTILERYDKYWSEVVAQVPHGPRQG